MNDNKLEELRGKIGDALNMNEKLLRGYPDYAPIVNSKEMLEEIVQHSGEKDYLIMNQARLNVGLLAAKSLDFEKNTGKTFGTEEDGKLYAYATTLHNVWGAVLTRIGKPFAKPTQEPQLTVYNFYHDHKYEDVRIASHMAGIDFNFPVGIVFLKEKNIVGQWRAPSISQGDYYAEINNCVTPDCLGIHDRQQDRKTKITAPRIEYQHELQKGVKDKDVDVLKSVAAAVLDTWSIKHHFYQTSGGCTQYFNANDKIKFDQIHP